MATLNMEICVLRGVNLKNLLQNLLENWKIHFNPDIKRKLELSLVKLKKKIHKEILCESSC